jgi:hypothetical protein
MWEETGIAQGREFVGMDEKPIREFIGGIRLCIPFDSPSKHDPLIKKIGKQMKLLLTFGKRMRLAGLSQTCLISVSRVFHCW